MNHAIILGTDITCALSLIYEPELDIRQRTVDLDVVAIHISDGVLEIDTSYGRPLWPALMIHVYAAEIIFDTMRNIMDYGSPELDASMPRVIDLSHPNSISQTFTNVHTIIQGRVLTACDEHDTGHHDIDISPHKCKRDFDLRHMAYMYLKNYMDTIDNGSITTLYGTYDAREIHRTMDKMRPKIAL